MPIENHQSRTIAGAWNSYSKAALPPTAGAVQRRETKQAFYAGAISLLGVLDELSTPEVSEEAGMAVLASLHHEARSYGADIQAGRE
jgi:hypothetical protein